MWVSRYFVYFVVYSCMGWIYETIYCTIKGRKWENRGFLYGPICPIYGAGAVGISAIEDILQAQNIEFIWWQVFLVGYFGSIVLEYVTSWALEKLFHAYWWDYSDKPFNIKGRVCLLYSIGFGVAGLLVIYVIAPFTEGIVDRLPAVGMEFVSLFFMMIVSADTTMTISALTNFERNVIEMEELINDHMEQFVINVQEKTQAAGTIFAEEKQGFMNRITEERERFSKESMEHSFRAMDWTSRSALKRVKGFRVKKTGSSKLNTVLDTLKRYVPGKKKKKKQGAA